MECIEGERVSKTAEQPKCEARMWGRGWVGDCGKPAKTQYEGKHYCGIHDPKKRRERQAAKDAISAAENAEFRAKVAARKAKEAETERRAACYDELLSAAVDAEAYIAGGYDDGRLTPYRAPVILRLRAAIAKAKPPTD